MRQTQSDNDLLAKRHGALHPAFGRRANDRRQRLQVENPLLAELLDRLPQQIAYYDYPSLICQYANAAYASTYQSTPEQIVGQYCQNIVSSQCWSAQAPMFEQVWAGEVLSYEAEIPGNEGVANPCAVGGAVGGAVDGEVGGAANNAIAPARFIEVSTLAHRHASGTPKGIVVLIQDISARHATEAALRNSEERLRSSDARHRLLLDNSEAGIAVVQFDKIVYANPAAISVFGVGGEEPSGRLALDYVHPDDRSAVIERMRQMTSGTRRMSFETRIVSNRNITPAVPTPLRWIRITASQRQWNNQPALQISFTDISESRRLNDQLRWALGQKDAILQNTAVGVCIVRGQTIEWVNHTLSVLLGYADDELTGQGVRAIYPSDEAYERARTALANTSDTDAVVTETMLQTQKGEAIWVQVEGKRLSPDGDQRDATFWTYVDISPRKQAEAEMKHALARERELSQLKSSFVSMASHEFRTPLTSIQTSSDLLLHYADQLSVEEKTNCIIDIQDAVTRMRLVMENVLVLGKLGADSYVYQPSHLPVGAFIQQLIAEVSSADSHAHIIKLNSPDDEAALHAQLDESLMRQIVGNLVSNACKYSPVGSTITVTWRRIARDPVLAPSTELASSVVADLRLEVSDLGIGIPADDIPKLFDTFHRASNVGQIPGTGLGLPIVKRALDTLGGRIEVFSTPNAGSRFVVHLPWVD